MKRSGLNDSLLKRNIERYLTASLLFSIIRKTMETIFVIDAVSIQYFLDSAQELRTMAIAPCKKANRMMRLERSASRALRLASLLLVGADTNYNLIVVSRTAIRTFFMAPNPATNEDYGRSDHQDGLDCLVANLHFTDDRASQ